MGQTSLTLAVLSGLAVTVLSQQIYTIPGVFPTTPPTICPYRELQNGRTWPEKEFYESYTFVNYVCDFGYRLLGNTSSWCIRRKWTSELPVCVGCIPPTVHHGSVSGGVGGSYKYGSKITLDCNEGYIPIGRTRAKCLRNGKWNAQFKCSDGCYAPQIAHMQILPAPVAGGNAYEFGHRIRFQCDAGYSTSESEAECRGKNKWDKNLPKCSVLSATTGCAMPSMTDGLILKNQPMPVYPYKAQLEFECAEGFSMVGSAVSICRKHLRGLFGGNRKHGDLDPSPPACNRVKCGSPGKPQNGRFRDGQKDAYYFGDTVYFVCDDKHIMSGTDHITCQANGQFSDIIPICQPPSCKIECKYVEGRECQCDAKCIERGLEGDCCRDFDQHCRVLFYNQQ